jgi:hypothetical protein
MMVSWVPYPEMPQRVRQQRSVSYVAVETSTSSSTHESQNVTLNQKRRQRARYSWKRLLIVAIVAMMMP